MNSPIEILVHFAPYQTALLALATLCLVVLVQSFLGAPLAFVSEEQVPGMPLKGGHELRSFRVLRTYSNSTENLPAFGFALMLAMILAVNVTLVNWLAVIHVGFRLAFWIAYYKGGGKIAGGPRTMVYVGGLVTNIVLVISCLYALLI